MSQKLKSLRKLRTHNFPAASSERKARTNEIRSILKEMDEGELYDEIHLLKNEGRPVYDIFGQLVNFQELLNAEALDQDVGRSHFNIYPSWKVFVEFMNEVDAFFIKDIPVDEWEDLGAEAVGVLLEVLEQKVSDIYSFAKFETLNERWNQRFSYLLNEKGYQRLKEFGPEY